MRCDLRTYVETECNTVTPLHTYTEQTSRKHSGGVFWVKAFFRLEFLCPPPALDHTYFLTLKQSQQRQLRETQVHQNLTSQKLKSLPLQTVWVNVGEPAVISLTCPDRRSAEDALTAWVERILSDVDPDDWLLTDGFFASHALSRPWGARWNLKLSPPVLAEPSDTPQTQAAGRGALEYFHSLKELMKSCKNYWRYFNMSRSRMSPSSGRWCVSVTHWHRA